LNGERINPFTCIQQLSNGEISNEAWVKKCQAFGIADLQLVTSTNKESAASQEALPFG
jgi:hypothetical protein